MIRLIAQQGNNMTGEELKKIWEASGFNKTVFAERINVTYKWYWAMETGRKPVGKKTLKALKKLGYIE